MYNRRPYPYRYICYSRVTGQAVWFYQGQSREGMTRKYYRTVASERKRKRQWAKVIKARQTNIRHLLSECMAELPILGKLTKEQREAAKALQQMAEDLPEFCSPLLDHDRERRHQNYLEKRRRRYWADAEYRRANKMRLRERRQQIKNAENNDNRDYVK